MRLGRRPEPFSDPDWLFELKYDGFRALAHLTGGECRLISRNGKAFKSFESLRAAIPGDLKAKQAEMDGEIVCLDAHGRTRFNDLLFHRTEPCFVAFDLLWCAGKDLRHLPLIDRKNRLRSLVRENAERILYASHVEGPGEELFAMACEHDLEGIVAKYRSGPYLSDSDKTSWFKIRNRRYSQMQGRNELFDRMAHRKHEMAETDGWAGCVLACAEAGM
jgi:bifunctional non-homologous end joining protein LigD